MLFTAKSLDRLVILSRELFDDSDPGHGRDRQRVRQADCGGAGPRRPTRVRFCARTARRAEHLGLTTTTHGANGAGITNYDFLLDAVNAVRSNNFEPNAHIVAPVR